MEAVVGALLVLVAVVVVVWLAKVVLKVAVRAAVVVAVVAAVALAAGIADREAVMAMLAGVGDWVVSAAQAAVAWVSGDASA